MDFSPSVLSAGRAWLAATMRGGGVPPLPFSALDMVDMANSEGVVAIVAHELTQHPTIDSGLVEAFRTGARREVAVAMLRDTQCRRVLALLSDAGIVVLLLKGSSVAWWLYPEEYLRDRADVDLLFESAAEAQRAAELLREHGFRGGLYFGPLAHEVTSRTTVAGSLEIEFDLHWNLFNAPVFAGVFPFEELRSEAIALPKLTPVARGLSPPHAFVHACIHRAKNLHFGSGDRLKWLYDLHLMIQCLSTQQWGRVLDLCRRHGVAGICLDGMAQAADCFGTTVPANVIDALIAAQSGEVIDVRRLGSWRYMQWMNLRALPTTRSRLRWIWSQLFPPTDYLREIYGEEFAGRTALLLARAGRFRGRMEQRG